MGANSSNDDAIFRRLAERWLRRHGAGIGVLDADGLAAALQRYLPPEKRDAVRRRALRGMVIDVAGREHVPTRWGLRPPDGGRSPDPRG